MEQYLPLIWLCVALVLGILEMATSQLISIWFVLGALSAAGTAVFVDDIFIQLIVFVAVSVLSLILTKPLVNKIKNVPEVLTNSDVNIGKVLIVLSEIEDNLGEVKIDDVIWRVKAFDDSPIHKGEKVKVREIDGTKLIVEHI